MQRSKLIKALTLTVVALVVASAALILGGPRQGLRAEVSVESADIGIPGISKMYEARLFNRSSWPVRVHYCAFVDDTNSPGTMVGYAVQRWDPAKHSWQTIVRANGPDFCTPYPLGIVRAHFESKLLWPGQSLSTGEEATAARDGFKIGDRARFLVSDDLVGDPMNAIATPEFVIDEHRSTDEPLRVRH